MTATTPQTITEAVAYGIRLVEQLVDGCSGAQHHRCIDDIRRPFDATDLASRVNALRVSRKSGAAEAIESML